MIEYKFNNGPTINIKNESSDTFLVKFYSNENSVKKFTNKALVKNNTYYHLLREWYTNWYIEVYKYDYHNERLELYDTHQFDLKDKEVAIILEPLSDEEENIWRMECKRFSSIHQCKTTVINTKKQPDIKFIDSNYYATYRIGRYNIEENSIKKYGDFEHYHGKINDVYITYDSFKNPRDWKNLNSKQIIDDILGLEYIETQKSFSNQLIDFYSNIKEKTEKNILELKDTFNVNFVDGPFFEVLGSSDNLYDVYIIDTDTNIVFYHDKITVNHWVKANKKIYTNWRIDVYTNDELVFSHTFNCKNERVYIALDSKSLGDTIAWFPYVEEFRKKHNCKVICSTFWNKMFESKYPEIEFVEPGTVLNNIYCMYKIGIFGNGHSKENKRDTRKQPLQSVATDILGLDFVEIKPKLCDLIIKVDSSKSYVCIAEHGSSQAKYWNRQNGWQEVVDELNKMGYEVRVISKEKTFLKNVIDETGDRPIEERIATLKGAKAFIGISSGLSWLAWACDIPVIMISGHTDEWYEFKCNRISPPEGVCHGCWHQYDFDKGDWNWCPVNKYTDQQFICTKQIEPSSVITMFNNIISTGSTQNVSENTVMTKKLKHSEFYVSDNEKPYNLIFEGPQNERDLYAEIFDRKIYEYNECIINEGDLVLDIGANIGIFSRYAESKGARIIYAFEPEEKNAILFNKNKPEKCVFFNMGISNIEKREKLYIDSTSGGHSIMMTNTFGTKTEEIQLPKFTTLDSIIEQEKITNIDFLKIDVEGAEFKVLYGLSDNNLMKVNKCVVEYHHNVFNYNDKKKTQFIKRFILNGFIFHEEIINKHFQIFYFWR